MSPDTNTAVIPDTRNIPTYSMAPYCQHLRFNDWHLLKTRRDKNSFLQEAATDFPAITCGCSTAGGAASKKRHPPTSAAFWLGHTRCRFTLAVSSCEAWPRKWKTTKHRFVVGAPKFTEIKPLLKVLTARWLSACSVIGLPWKCSCLRTSGRPRWSKGFPTLLVLWTMK